MRPLAASKMTDYQLLRELTRAVRAYGHQGDYLNLLHYLSLLRQEARSRLVREAQSRQAKRYYPLRRCCPRSARCRGPFPEIRRYLRALDGKDFPADGLESHFGVSFDHGRFTVSLGAEGGQEHPRLFLGLYPSFWGSASEPLMRDWRAQAQRHGRVVKWWKGSSGGRLGLSLVLARPCPVSLAAAIANYSAQEDVFSNTPATQDRYDRFDAWLKARLRKVR